MTVYSYGILLYRKVRGKKNRKSTEVFLIQPDGPHFRNSTSDDLWGFPKGRKEKGEEPLEVAKREFCEEVGMDAPDLDYKELSPLVTYRGKVITIFAADATGLNVEWKGENVHKKVHVENGVTHSYGETRNGNWLPLDDALQKIGRGQRNVLEDFMKEFRVTK